MSVFGGAPKQSPNQTVTNKTEPPEYLIPHLKDIAAKAGQAYDIFKTSGYDKPYTGDRIADRTVYDRTAVNKALAAAGNFSGMPQNTFDLGQFFTDKTRSGAYTAPGNMAFDLGTNDQTKAAIEAAVRPVLRNFDENLVPRLQSAGIESGAFGGSKFSEAGNRIARDTEQTIGDIAAKITYEDFLQRRNLGQQDFAQRRAMMPQLSALELTAAQQGAGMQEKALQQELGLADIYGNVGDTERGFTQQELDDQLNYWNEMATSPWRGLGEYSNLIQGVGGQAGGATSQTTYGYQPRSTGFLQGLAGLQGLSGMASSAGAALPGLFQSGGIFGPAAGFIGPSAAPAGVGTISSILSFLSDARAKENVIPRGTKNGHKVYEYSYKGLPGRWLGVMAQEVQKYLPEAVSSFKGMLLVDYSKLGFEMRRV